MAQVLLVLLAAAGCGDPDPASQGDPELQPQTVTEEDFEGLSVVWEPCSLHPGADDGLAECSEVEMPLRWESPSEGGTFRTLAKRLLSNEPTVEGQLWLLPGGPGQSGTLLMHPLMEALRDANLGFDLYTLDARGTGGSEWLGCPDQQSHSSDLAEQITLDELDACLVYLDDHYGDRLDVYGATHAAIDLAAFVHRTRDENQKVLIWGFSAGTLWIQRYLQFFPQQVDGVILEGIAAPDWSAVFQDEAIDRIGRELFADCRADPYCSGKLPDPEATLVSLIERGDLFPCSLLPITTGDLLGIIGQLSYSRPTNQLVPGFIYRMDRCNGPDVVAILQFLDLIFMEPEPEFSMSHALLHHQIYSEHWEHGSFADNGQLLNYLDEVYEDVLFVDGLGYERNEFYLRWPRYSDPYDDIWAKSDVPMLMLQGQLDPATAHDWALRVAEHFDGPHQNWASFPHSAHNVSSGSPLAQDPDGPHCGWELAMAFMREPRGALDLSCIDETLPLDFRGSAWAPELMGTEDFFENVPAFRSPMSLRQRITLQQIRDRLRHLSPPIHSFDEGSGVRGPMSAGESRGH